MVYARKKKQTRPDTASIYGCLMLLMAEILHRLYVVFPIIYRVSYIPGGAGFQPSTVGIRSCHGL